jgi:hypothetical protein
MKPFAPEKRLRLDSHVVVPSLPAAGRARISLRYLCRSTIDRVAISLCRAAG